MIAFVQLQLFVEQLRTAPHQVRIEILERRRQGVVDGPDRRARSGARSCC